MKIFLANYATAVDHACLADDGGYDTIEDMASNFPIGMSKDGSPAWRQKMQDKVARECADADPDVEDKADADAFVAAIEWDEVRPGTWHAKRDGDNEFPIYAVLLITEGEVE